MWPMGLLLPSLNWLSGSGKGRFFFLNHQGIVPNLLSSPLLKRCDPSFERSFINPLPNDDGRETFYPMCLVLL